jgi:uncharacterized protein (TIGR02996 family)
VALPIGLPPLQSEVVLFDAAHPPVRMNLASLGERFTVGRSVSNWLRVEDPFVSSGRHFAFEPRADGLWLSDCGHINGQMVNGERVNGDRLLRVGDVITLGRAVTIRFLHRLAGPEHAQSPVPPRFLRAIVADPYDEAPRAVYTDWLLEQGRTAPDEPDSLAPLTIPVESWRLTAGFLTEVTVCAFAVEAADLEALCRAHPIQRIVVSPGTGSVTLPAHLRS